MFPLLYMYNLTDSLMNHKKLSYFFFMEVLVVSKPWNKDIVLVALLKYL
jgi:hypothetical protein